MSGGEGWSPYEADHPENEAANDAAMARAARDADWGYATMLGEAVWHRICGKRGIDPKAESNRRSHDEIVHMIRDAAFVLDSDGFEGLSDWLRLESWADVPVNGDTSPAGDA